MVEEVVSLLFHIELFDYTQGLSRSSLNSLRVGPEPTPTSAILSSISPHVSPAKLAARRMVHRPSRIIASALAVLPSGRFNARSPSRDSTFI